MKYSSRLTALLLALMMIISSAGAELNTSGLTVDQLNHLYEAASEDPVYEYLPADVLGFETALSVDNAADLAASGYTFQWYEILANGAHCEIVGATDYLYPTEYPLEAKQYYCIYTDPDGIAYRSKVFVIAATTTDLDSYLNLLYSLFSDDFGVYDSQKIYEYMTDTWNITLSTGENLAQNVMDYWWSDWSEENRDCDMLCTCVASGKVASDYTILHPNSDAHDPNCYWAKAPIVVSADVSTPDLLKEGQTIVLTSPDAEASYFYWQEYRYNAEANAWEWESVSGGSSYELTVNADSIQAAYRVISNYEDGMYVIPVESRTFFLGGEEFHNWIKTANGILPWLSEDGVTVEQAAAKYSEYLANKDEEDRTNATDYTFTDEDASVNLQVSEDVFAEDYVMEIEAVTPSADVVDAVLKSMDATGTAVMQVLKAFDISFAALEDRTRKLQPSAGQSVTLTFEVSTADVPTDDTYYLYVYHIANDGTPEVVAGPVQVAGSAMTIEVQADGFSTYLVMATNDLCPYCVNHEYCVYYYLNGEERENQYELLITAGAEDNDWFYDTTYDKIMLDYKNHMDAGETPILCTCGRQDENGFIYAPNAAGHANGCLWSIYTLNDVGLCGIPTTILVNNADVLAGGYQITWYRNGDVIVGETDTSLDVTPTMEDVTYQWKATHNDTNEVVMGDPVTVIAQHTVLGEYVEYAFNYRNTNEERYILLTDTWNVDFTTEETNGNVVTTVSKNLAEEIISYWYAKCLADPEGYMYYDVFCDCVVSGKLSSHELLLHPDTGHMTDCPWYVEGNDVIVPEKPDQPELYYGNPDGAQYTSTETYSLPMANDRAVILPKGGRAIIQSNQTSDAQWQVYDGTQWIDIQGETATDIVVTDAKLNTVFELTGIAQLRYFDKTNSVVLASVSVTSQEIAGGEDVEPVTLYAVSREGNSETGSGDYNVVINYVFENNEIVYEPYTANLAAGSNFSAVVPFPTIQGYLPYLGNATEASSSLTLNITGIQENITYTVTYKPTNVNYTVIHYQQNVDNDGYTQKEIEPKQGLTGSTVLEVAKTYEGFFALLYEKPEIAADGSTVVEIYYDRNYYLMLFELDGGYGVEPIYARYGAAIGDVGTPNKAGYSFLGWSLDGSTIVDLPETMPAGGATYKAVWQEDELVKVHLVFWGENANDSEYSPLEVSSGQDYFMAKPGATINYSTGNIVCGYTTEHSHTAECYRCDLEEHKHSADCCTITAHTHGAHCCTIEAHTHTDGCCSIAVHTHSTSCYAGVGSQTNGNNRPNNPAEGQVDEGRSMWGSNPKYIYIKGNWYNYTGSTADGQIAPTTCGQTEGSHADHTCVYDKCGYAYEHTHDDGDCVYCNEPEHTHGEGSCVYCDLPEHTHVPACLTCPEYEHRHSTSCYITNPGVDGTLWEYKTSDTVTVAADGSTVMNVYYDRVEYTFTFIVGNSTIHSFSAKWGENIREKWTFTGTNGTKYSPENKDSWTGNVLYTQRIYMVEIMPASNITFTRASGNNTSNTFHYYVESVENTAGTNKRQFESKYYDFQFQLVNDFRTLYYDEDFFELEGFTKYKSARANGNEYPLSNNGTSPIDNLYFYYTRNRYDIEFYNPTDLIKTNEDVPYGAPLAGYNWTPDSSYAPASYATGSVRFAGWYLNPECSEGHEYDLTTHTMPVGSKNGEVSLRLYAKWEPVPLTVEFYLDFDAFEDGSKLPTHPDVEVFYGEKVTPIPATPTNGDYTFVNWFYMDGDEEKAFDFANMPITKDLQVYGKWSSNVLKKYIVYFKIQGTDTQIAEPITGSTKAGETKTFDAKGGEELKPGYQDGYFPLVESHSITLLMAQDEDTENTTEWYMVEGELIQGYTFWYVQKDAVPYTVYYVAETLKDGEDESKYQTITRKNDKGVDTTYYIIADTITNSDNRKAVVTEQFKAVSGYMPDAYQKRLVVDGSDGAENEIIFYYTVDSVHSYYKITHYTQNTDGENWTEFASSEAQGVIGEIYTANPLTIDGYTFDQSVEGTVVSGKLEADGLELKLYYTRNSYPYEVRYLEQATGKQLADPKQAADLYGKVVSESAINIPNYTAVDPTSQTLTIKIEESQKEAKLNIITFYYVEQEVTISYEVVGPTGCGTVSPTNETVKKVTGVANGSTATASGDTYKFVGWYSDEACKTLVSPNPNFVPPQPGRKIGTDGVVVNGLWPDKTTYYAKFEYNLTSLTIKKSGVDETIDPNTSFVFNVSGDGINLDVVIHGNDTVTIDGLTVDETYTITEKSGSWRYVPDDSTKEITLVPDASSNVVKFVNKREYEQWLDSETSGENVFKDVQTPN